MKEQCSDIFIQAFHSGGGGCLRTCECGRTHFDTYNTWDWDDGELEELEKKAIENPDKYVESDGSASCIEIDGREIVIGCCCDFARKYEAFIKNNAEQIADYLRLYAAQLRERAEKVDVPIGVVDHA